MKLPLRFFCKPPHPSGPPTTPQGIGAPPSIVRIPITVVADKLGWPYIGVDEIERRLKELTQATSDQPVDEMQLYYDVLGDCLKSRVYRLGSYCSKKRRFGDPGASTSHKTSPSEVKVLRQKLAHFEAIIESHLGVRTSRALPPPPRPPQEQQQQQQQVRIDPTNPPERQRHDGDDRDIHEQMREEHLGDEKKTSCILETELLVEFKDRIGGNFSVLGHCIASLSIVWTNTCLLEYNNYKPTTAALQNALVLPFEQMKKSLNWEEETRTLDYQFTNGRAYFVQYQPHRLIHA
ncbi:hypothetical protein Sjap_025826 [Stephania japonica]|uniref:Uncharacterized protein n=1 Tax=Stephania japonica TaxID=461633 RepID=A0AAP0E4Z6_9MAGN